MAITLTAVDVQINNAPILKGLNLVLTERRIGIIGANGSGKSTFARLLSGLIKPSSGEVVIDGLCFKKDRKAIRQKISLVLQNPDHQIILPIVEEDLAFSLKARGYSKPDIKQKIDEILAYYDLADLRQHSTYTLSGGEKQMIAIAGALIHAPEFLIFDEPTTLLDLKNKRRIQQVIMDLPQAAMVVTHDLDLLADFDRVLVFDEGCIVADAKPEAAIEFYINRMCAS